MKKRNILNLIKYHVDQDDFNFRNEAMKIAESFDKMGDGDLSNYVLALLGETDTFVPQTVDVNDKDVNNIYEKAEKIIEFD